MLKKILPLLLIFFCAAGFGQKRILSEDAIVTILTCDTGNELYSLFGHTAIRVSDPINGVDVVYNYGAFDFRTPNFYLKFIKGDMKYFVTTGTYDDFIAEYVYDKRGVYEQKLIFTQAQKQEIFDKVNAVLSSDARFYTYKFIDRNCTTMVADLVESTTLSKLSLEIKDAAKTNRTILFGYLHDHFYENLGINIMFGAKTDKDFYKVYLPLQFMESLGKSTNNGHPLTAKAMVVNPKANAQTAFSIWNNYYSYLLALLFFILINKRSIYLTYLIINGFLGIFLIWAGFYSLHEELILNYNILMFNPLLLLLVFLVLKQGSPKIILWTAYSCSLLLLIYLLWMFSKPHLLMFLPMIAANGIILGRIISLYSRK